VADEREPSFATHDLRSAGPLEIGAPSFGVSTAVLEAELPPPDGEIALQAARSGRPWSSLGWGFWLAAAVVALWILAAIFANFLPLPNPNTVSFSCLASSSPGAGHLLGCDPAGRDTLARIVYGARVSMIIGFASIAMGIAVGGSLGMVAGYFRGAVDEVLSVISNVFLSFPSLVLAIVIIAYFPSRSVWIIAFVIALVSWPLLFRIVRAATIESSQRDYVLAVKALGATPSRILRTVLLSDIVPAAITYGLIGVALAIVGEGALSFLGLSVPPPTATWGNMIAEGANSVSNVTSSSADLSLLLSPSIAMFSFILAVNFMGDRLRTLLDVRQGSL
jgi:peptide/nickel transport system permease protein